MGKCLHRNRGDGRGILRFVRFLFNRLSMLVNRQVMCLAYSASPFPEVDFRSQSCYANGLVKVYFGSAPTTCTGGGIEGEGSGLRLHGGGVLAG